METIGFLELSSIAKGIEAADAMLKSAEVSMITAKASCPGKYHVLITGDVAAVKSSIEAGETIAEGFVIESTVIPRVHPQVIRAISAEDIPEQANAVGIVEFMSVTSSIMCADAAVKAADVKLIDVRLGSGIGGKSFVILTGEVSAVKTSVESGAKAGSRHGFLLNKVTIPNPHRDIFESLC